MTATDRFVELVATVPWPMARVLALLAVAVAVGAMVLVWNYTRSEIRSQS
ncbi:hypothetical protein [Tenggerimyces flavus]|uniref:Uncharacterized protein n=1 Tax=Tenggerimyces flavus TaxID=1708749 RepID=A0ABV7YD98_9ACTN|nr:hypothetical protein [Tenggerimyces flavus]MBM7788839.1 hypothetical protein [Tenggerimyces flavus]